VISLDDYFGTYLNMPEIDAATHERAESLLERVNALLEHAQKHGIVIRINPRSGTRISGTLNGGWRPKNCPIGAENSSHKDARGVDVYDPVDALDYWLTDEILTEHGLYREHPSETPSWCHLTDRAPKSGKRTFMP
jgi:hypothetical protein